jgi:peptidoglycan hydrolase-like protein with peptidoglycan-binding domain
MSEVLRQGSRGEEVRRLQRNLNAAIGRRYGTIAADGIFGPRTKQAVERYQKDFQLKSVDGIVGPETRNALATRVLIIEGTMSRSNSSPSPSPSPSPSASPNPAVQTATAPSVSAPTPVGPQPTSPPESPFLIQLQPAFGLTPPPFASRSPAPTPPGPAPSTIVAGQLALGIVYRTASDGPHWEFGGAFQPSFNSRNQPTDPRYTLQLQGSVAYADPLSAGRFHTSLFAQVVALQNFAPASTIVGLQFGGQISVDIIADRWSLFSQAALAGQWTLHDSGGPPGLLQFGPQFTVLGTTVQWGL